MKIFCPSCKSLNIISQSTYPNLSSSYCKSCEFIVWLVNSLPTEFYYENDVLVIRIFPPDIITTVYVKSKRKLIRLPYLQPLPNLQMINKINALLTFL